LLIFSSISRLLAAACQEIAALNPGGERQERLIVYHLYIYRVSACHCDQAGCRSWASDHSATGRT